MIIYERVDYKKGFHDIVEMDEDCLTKSFRVVVVSKLDPEKHQGRWGYRTEGTITDNAPNYIVRLEVAMWLKDCGTTVNKKYWKGKFAPKRKADEFVKVLTAKK